MVTRFLAKVDRRLMDLTRPAAAAVADIHPFFDWLSQCRLAGLARFWEITRSDDHEKIHSLPTKICSLVHIEEGE